ncbi:DUF2730 domain-containing protein [Aquincola tertiaricarbonis]|uniref:DUF2730 domain-containing protein n=1 Tax=Aquincola tertiaricarbonis TaxID=391953 RepID=A0ABY4S1Z6_AQUTE|nr:DUF2730 family protein [Aquincola tertiaricarbonis]URI06640.1 DUF2730 domain-containing protein [Aquincola tertiaricarbonis]
MPDFSPSFWLSAVQWLYMLILTAVVWLRKPGVDAGAAVERVRTDHGGELQTIKARISAIETTLHHTPTKEDLARLEGSVRQVDERTEGLSEGLSAVRRQLNRIEDYLLNNKAAP